MKDENEKKDPPKNFRKLLLQARLEEIDSILAQCKGDFVPSERFNKKLKKILKDTTENKNTN